MMRSRMDRSASSLLDQFLLRRRGPAVEGPPPSDGDRNCARVAFAEMMAAATVLDFGGLPVEMPAICDMWPADTQQRQ
jgi:hypothetical protein